MTRILTASAAALMLITGLSACEPSSYNFFDPVEGGLNKNGIGGTSTSSDCTNVIEGVDFEDDMVCGHNTVRANPPSPQPVPDPELEPLDWSNELADWADDHANQCVYESSDSAARPSSEQGPAGETLFAAPAGTYTDADVVREWADDAAFYNYSSNSCGGCERYLRIVWRETYELGCAKVTCDTLTNRESLGRADFWVCNYLHPGPVDGLRPY